MMEHRFKGIIKRQHGFTLVEVLIVIVITGILGTAVVMSITQLLQGSSVSNNTNTVVNNGRIAGEWMMRDAEMAQARSDLPGAATLPSDTGVISFIRVDTDSNVHKIEYSMPNGTTDLIRKYYVNGNLQNQTTVAQYITSVTPAFDTSTTILTLTITVTVPLTLSSKTETRIYQYQIKPRVY